MDPETVERYHQLVNRFTPGVVPRGSGETVAAPHVSIVTRVRPLLSKEVDAGLPTAVFPRSSEPDVIDVHELSRSTFFHPATLKSSHFRSSLVYDSTSTTKEIYDDFVKPLLPWAWEGGVSTLFAYGQTASGKTYTVSRLQRMVAEYIMSGKLDGKRRVYVTIIELAGNSAHDLVNSREPVNILQDSFGAIHLSGAREEKVKSAADMLALIDTATTFRRTDATDKNDSSSRSHAICRIRIVDPASPAAEPGLLYLVDLAGSEEARDTTAHGPQRMRETREINSSLSVLKSCIHGKGQVDAQRGTKKAPPHVPIRQSALTKVLKHVFDPESTRTCKTLVIGCVSPSLADVGPTKNTLRYAEALRVMVPKAKVSKYNPLAPMTWTNEQLKAWVETNSGSPPISGEQLAPFESGMQILRLPEPEFEARCLKTKRVTVDQAKAFRSKLWQMHTDAKRGATSALAKAAGRPSPYESIDSKDPNPSVMAKPFKDRLRPGMVVSWTPPSEFPVTLTRPDSRNMVYILCPAGSDKDLVADEDDYLIAYDQTGPSTKVARYVCAVVTPAQTDAAYEIQLWKHIEVDVEKMDAEVILEYDAASRLYHIIV